METEFYELSPELEDHFEIFEHIQGFNVTIVTSTNTQKILYHIRATFCKKMKGII
ncbi:hypothetical protein AMTR_s00189p00026600, partial [Amborella trichopoda]